MSRGLTLDLSEQPIRNFAIKSSTTVYRLGSNLGNGASAAAYTSDWVGVKQSVCQLTKALSDGSNNSGYTYAQVTNINPQLYGMLSVTMSVWVKPSVSGNIRIPRRQAGPGVATYINRTFSTTAGVWQRLTTTYPVESAATQLILEVGWEAGDQSTAATVLIANVMITAGSKVYDFADGTMPGWKWDGTVGSSTSVGFPYTLESLVGKPQIYLTNPGSSADYTAAALQGRTAYYVGNRIAVNNSGNAVNMAAMVGNGNNTGFLRHSSSGGGYAEFRPLFTNGGGVGGEYAVAVGSPVPANGAPYLYSVGVPDGLASYEEEVNRGTVVTRTSMNVADGWVNGGNASLGTDLRFDTHVAFYVFTRFHSRTVRDAVAAWLANHYGVTLVS